jgi:hypothetical protein
MTRINLILGIFLMTVILPLSAIAQRISVTGFVIDSKTGVKIKDVDIYEKLSGIGTTSNESGFFKLLLQKGKIELEVSESGYLTLDKDLIVKSDTTIDLELKLKKDSMEISQAGETKSQKGGADSANSRLTKPKHQ